MKQKNVIFFFGVISLLGLIYAQEPKDATVPQAAPADYLIQPGDTVDVRFFFNPEMNEQGVQVRPDGRISMQLVGDVQFAGKTVAEVSKVIEEAYAKTLRTPKVSIQIRGYSTQKAYVAGEVPRPGTISLGSSMTVLTAIGEAGGILARGDRKRVVLIRKMDDGKPARRDIQLFAGKTPTPDAMIPLKPFDVILVPESKIARVDRWVDQYIRQMIPMNMSAGFTYLWQHNPVGGGGGVVVAPF